MRRQAHTAHERECCCGLCVQTLVVQTLVVLLLLLLLGVHMDCAMFLGFDKGIHELEAGTLQRCCCSAVVAAATVSHLGATAAPTFCMPS